MQILVNGEQREVGPETTVAGLLEQLELDPRYLAVELNKQLVPRSDHSDKRIEAGDQLEVVTLVGGG